MRRDAGAGLTATAGKRVTTITLSTQVFDVFLFLWARVFFFQKAMLKSISTNFGHCGPKLG